MTDCRCGRATLTLDWADRLLTLCNMRLVVSIALNPQETR